MNNNRSFESFIADNFQKANDYLKSHGWFPYFLLGFWSLVFIIAAFVDYGLTYDFFHNLAKNEYGIVPEELLFMVQLKAFLGTSIVLLLEYSFFQLSWAVRRLTFWCLFILILFALWNIGGAQILPLLDDYVMNEYTEEVSNDAFSEWLGVEEKELAQSDQELDSDDENKSIDESIGKNAFVKNAKWYRSAFMLFSFLGLVAIIHIKKTIHIVGNLAKAKRVVKRYKLLERSEQLVQGHENDFHCLKDNKKMLYRAAQEEVLAAFTCGLRLLKTRLNKLIIYGEKNDAFSVYSLWQKSRPIRIDPMNIEETKAIIRLAENSLQNINLFDPGVPPEEKSIVDTVDENVPDDFGINVFDNAASIESVFEEA